MDTAKEKESQSSTIKLAAIPDRRQELEDEPPYQIIETILKDDYYVENDSADDYTSGGEEIYNDDDNNHVLMRSLSEMISIEIYNNDIVGERNNHTPVIHKTGSLYKWLCYFCFAIPKEEDEATTTSIHQKKRVMKKENLPWYVVDVENDSSTIRSNPRDEELDEQAQRTMEIVDFIRSKERSHHHY
jgi:hypothetical protein